MAKSSTSAAHDRLAGYTIGNAPVAVEETATPPEVFLAGQG